MPSEEFDAAPDFVPMQMLTERQLHDTTGSDSTHVARVAIGPLQSNAAGTMSPDDVTQNSHAMHRIAGLH
jgi:bifunctional N-acetylglucosamine-1-phosphate-uridyltransferase/glucosamine-1-phosphate-acetyltransferase GlmU-like protein